MVALFTIFILVLLLLLEGPKMRTGLLGMMSPERAERWSRIAGQVNRSVTGYMLGNFLTSLIAGLVVFVTLLILGVPFAILWALWVALVNFLPMIGGALAGIPTVLFALAHSLTAGIVTLVVFLVYTQIENHVLNPVVMSRTVSVNPLLVLLSILVGASLGSWLGGTFGAFVAALIAIPTAGAIQVVTREIWRATEPVELLDTSAAPGPPSTTAAARPAGRQPGRIGHVARPGRGGRRLSAPGRRPTQVSGAGWSRRTGPPSPAATGHVQLGRGRQRGGTPGVAGRGLEGVRHAQQLPVRPPAADQLEPHRQPVRGEPGRHRDGRQPGGRDQVGTTPSSPGRSAAARRRSRAPSRA